MKNNILKGNKKSLNSFKDKQINMKKEACNSCGCELVNKKELVISNGKSVSIDVQECKKCGESFATLKETERVRRVLHPSLWTRIKAFFGTSSNTNIAFLKGKVL